VVLVGRFRTGGCKDNGSDASASADGANGHSNGDGGGRSHASDETLLCGPCGLAVDRSPKPAPASTTAFPTMNAPALYIADSLNGRVRKIDRTGAVSTLAGIGRAELSADAKKEKGAAVPAASAAPAAAPAAVANGAAGSSPQSPSSPAAPARVVDGPASAATFAHPTSLAVDSESNVFVCDTHAHCIRKITPPAQAHGGQAQVSTFVGRPIALTPNSPAPKTKDLTGTEATLWFPTASTRAHSQTDFRAAYTRRVR
jgi:hypothetical protein